MRANRLSPEKIRSQIIYIYDTCGMYFIKDIVFKFDINKANLMLRFIRTAQSDDTFHDKVQSNYNAILRITFTVR